MLGDHLSAFITMLHHKITMKWPFQGAKQQPHQRTFPQKNTVRAYVCKIVWNMCPDIDLVN